MVRIVEFAEARGVQPVPHAWKSGIIKAASLHVNAIVKGPEVFQEYCVSSTVINERLTHESFPLDADGYVAVPTAPGSASLWTTTSSSATAATDAVRAGFPAVSSTPMRPGGRGGNGGVGGNGGLGGTGAASFDRGGATTVGGGWPRRQRRQGRSGVRWRWRGRSDHRCDKGRSRGKRHPYGDDTRRRHGRSGGAPGAGGLGSPPQPARDREGQLPVGRAS